MPNKSDYKTFNPYASPRSASERVDRVANALWVGPLLTFSVVAICATTLLSAVTVVEEDQWLMNAVVAVGALVGAISLGTSFWLYRRAKCSGVED